MNILSDSNFESNRSNSYDLDTLLTQVRSPIKNIREEAEKLIQQFSNLKFENFLINLSQILSDEKYSDENRQMACYIIKNKILSKENIPVWINCSQLNNQVIVNVKNNLIATLATNKEKVRRAVGNLIATMVRIEIKFTNWPYEVIEILLKILNNEDSFAFSAVETLGYIFEEISSEKTTDLKFEQMTEKSLNTILTIMNNYYTNEQMMINSLKCFINLIPLCQKYVWVVSKNYFEFIFNTIFQIAGKYLHCYDKQISIVSVPENYQKIIELICHFFVQICEKFYFNLDNYMHKIMNFTNLIFSIYNKNFKNNNELINNNIITERIALFTLEIWCNIGDKELELSNIYSNFSQKSLKYYEKEANDLYNLCIENITKINTSSEHKTDEWNISKACAYILCILVQTTNSSYLEKLLVYSENNYNSQSEIKRYSSLLTISCCLETIHRDKISTLLKNNFKNFIRTLSDKSELVSVTSSWLLCKLTTLFAYIIDRKMLSQYIPFLVKIIHDGTDGGFFEEVDYYNEEESSQEIRIYSKQIRVNICQVLINLIKFYGDKNLSKNTNPIGGCYLQILDKCVFTAFDIENFVDKNFNLSFHSFQVMNSVIENSALDFQDYLEVIMNTFIDLFEKINTDFKNELNFKNSIIISEFSKHIINNIQTKTISNLKLREFLFNLQENVCVFIEKIFKQIIRKVKPDLCERLYNYIISSFKLRGDVYEQGISLLSYIAISK